MLFTENIFVALAGLKANIMRSLLTMLGIIIGIASVIAIMTVGNSITLIVNTTMQDLGANNLELGVMQKSMDKETLATGASYGAGYARSMTEQDLITEDMITAFREEFPDNIKYIIKQEQVGDKTTVTDGNKTANIKIVGYNKDYFGFKDIKLIDGRQFLNRDYENAQKVCLVTDKFVERIYDGDNKKALGQVVEINISGTYYSYYIVGVYEYVQDEFSFGVSDNPTTELVIPYETARYENHNQNKGDYFLTIVTTVDTDNDEFAVKVRDFFNVNFYSRNDSYEVMVISMSSMMDSMNSMIGTIQMALAVIAGISLVVGGIGVMNIMLVSITERTKEIGTRKALGATNSSIRMQFITESVVICLIGGIIGIILGIVLGTFAVKLMGHEAAVSLESIVIAVGFSMAIGIFFGYYPANKAAKLNPIDALRYE